ncbi:hypothetical protein GCM10022232_55190 [Streptomyces plumbiresistens]|uniref:Uncharacterized protein n=1 Tax=Streptomyces plumbiresistens TaxID=511811 RepID=A0ABP7S7P0_9ACTN
MRSTCDENAGERLMSLLPRVCGMIRRTGPGPAGCGQPAAPAAPDVTPRTHTRNAANRSSNGTTAAKASVTGLAADSPVINAFRRR